MVATTYLRTSIIALWLAACSLTAADQINQPVSVTGLNVPPPTAGGGNSFLPVISANGRYVLFASSANNLAENTNGDSFTSISPPALNVYLRDRTAGTTKLVSINAAGTGGGDDDSIPMAISTNGQFALFESRACNIVPGDTNNAQDIFVRDVINGVTMLASVSTNGVAGNGPSQNSFMTPDGRFVAFASAASNLVPGDTNQITDVFVRDLQLGITTLASPGAVSTVLGSPPLTIGSDFPQITPDGRYVTFYSSATNLVTGVLTSGEIYVRDLTGGGTIDASAGAHAIAVSVFSTTNIISYNQLISDDGQYIAYEITPTTGANRAAVARYNVFTGLTDTVNTNAVGCSLNSDLLSLPGVAPRLNITPDGRFLAFSGYPSGTSGTTNTYIYLWDGLSNQTSVITRDIHNAIPAISSCDVPVMDSTGRYIAFIANTLSLTTNTPAGGYHIYVRDVLTGTNTLADVDTNGIASGSITCGQPEMTPDGQSIAFASFDATFVSNDSNHAYDVFLRDLSNNTTELISSRLPSLPSAAPDGLSRMIGVSLSTNARYAVFMSDADNLVSGDTNGCRDVFVRDLLLGTNTLVSVSTDGITIGTGMSFDPVISGTGRYVAFTSSASNLVTGDQNNLQDVFVRDLQLGSTALVSVSTNGINSGNGASFSPLISADGRYVVFHSAAPNLVIPSTSAAENIFRRDLLAGTTAILSSNTSLFSTFLLAMSPNGRYIALGGSNTTNVV